jgi:endonuclease III
MKNDNKAFDSNKFNKLISELKRLIEDNDFRSGKKIDEILSLPGIEPYSSALKVVEIDIKNFDFDEAIQKLNEV